MNSYFQQSNELTMARFEIQQKKTTLWKQRCPLIRIFGQINRYELLIKLKDRQSKQ